MPIALIVGAGVGGLAAAIALHRVGLVIRLVPESFILRSQIDLAPPMN